MTLGAIPQSLSLLVHSDTVYDKSSPRRDRENAFTVEKGVYRFVEDC